MKDLSQRSERYLASRRANGRKGGLKSKGGGKGAHMRWHVKRGVYDPNCAFCASGQHTNDGTMHRHQGHDPSHGTIGRTNSGTKK